VGAVVIAAGGTGGHVYPALAAAREIALLDPSLDLLFLGSATGLEARVVPGEGFMFRPVSSGPWHRGRPWTILTGGLKALRGAVEARRAMREAGARAVLSTGGWAAAPALLAAFVGGIPIVVHEPNRAPGVVNRAFGRVAARVTVGDSDAARRFPAHRTVVTGVPVRKAVVEATREEARRRLGLGTASTVVLVMGGSQAARSINAATCEALPALAAERGLELLWLCGASGLAECSAAAERAGVRAKVMAYLDDMGSGLAAADLAVARAGASTVAELAVARLPSVLVPYPQAAGDHQTANAQALERAGAAVLLSQASLSGAALAAAVLGLARDAGRRTVMAGHAGSLARPDAARRVAEETLATVRGGAGC